MQKLILLFLAIVISIQLDAQKTLKKGHLRYALNEVSVEGIKLETDIGLDMKDLLELAEGSTLDIYLHKIGQRLDIDVPGLVELRVMYLYDEKEVVTLLNVFGQKMQSREPMDLDASLSGRNVLDNRYVNIRHEDSDVKTIAGQSCSKVVIEISKKMAGLDQDIAIEVYASDEYKLPEIGYLPAEFNDFKGAPMEIAITSGSDVIILRATEFNKKVSKKVFEIPKGYKPMEEGDIVDDIFRM